MNPSNNTNSSSNRWFNGCLLVLAGAIAAGMLWFFAHLPEQKEYTPPDQLKLTTRDVPLSRQVLILVDDSPGSAYARSIRSEVASLTDTLTEEGQVCLVQVVSDQLVAPVTPWCSDQIKRTWWQLPEIKPAPYLSPEEEQAYKKARTKLEYELGENLARAQATWEEADQMRLKKVETFLWQLPEQWYRSLGDSLARLLTGRNRGLAVTEVVIYSPMVDNLFGQPVTQTVDLSSSSVQVRVMTEEGEAGLQRVKQNWEAWFKAGKPQALEWSYLLPETKPGVSKPKVRTQETTFLSDQTKGLPPVVPKPAVDDRTNVIQGEEPGATNVVREVDPH